MKKIILILSSLLFLSSCAQGGPGLSDFSDPSDPSTQTRPQIPLKPSKPVLPVPGSQQPSTPPSLQPSDGADMDRLVKEIDSQMTQENIAYEDIDKGWYYAGKNEKKVGTPSTWEWIDDGEKSRWISPSAIQEDRDTRADRLCQSTAGTFVISCAEREALNCEHEVARSECRCIEGSKWADGQGCIAVDKSGKFVTISPDDLRNGWYTGLPNDKKFDTPSYWIWVDNGKESRWQNSNSR